MRHSRTVAGLVLAGAMLPLLGGCVIYSHDGSDRVTVTGGEAPSAASAPLESLSQVRFDGHKMTAGVASNGCTEVSSFEVQIVDGDPARVSLMRRAPDQCRAHLPEGVTLSWTYEELGLKPGQTVQVANPLSL